MMSWAIFEVMGTVAFALSGTMVGLARRMDVFGIAVLACVTAVGGGIIRDILAGIAPPLAMRDPLGIFLALATAALVTLIYTRLRVSRESRHRMEFLYDVSDTIGLAAFTVTGAMMGAYALPESSYVFPVTLGTVTAVGGGIVRDLLAMRVPTVLRMDVYASASVVGALIYCVVAGTSKELASWAAFVVVIVIRMLALRYGWQLYHPRSRRRRESLSERGVEQHHEREARREANDADV